ncbi:MAG TPA: hypothetical protein VNZ06_04005 [Steroidobacteraceae bacterium]|jgi:hypothetical protein|nr:hypothetical protein [Steroidobacteraceae bacterium]
MTRQRTHSFSTALLLTALTLLQPVAALADHKPPKPGLLLGSHPSKQAKAARLAVLKQRTSAVPLKPLHSPKVTNSLNHRAGKTMTVPQRPPK